MNGLLFSKLRSLWIGLEQKYLTAKEIKANDGSFANATPKIKKRSH